MKRAADIIFHPARCAAQVAARPECLIPGSVVLAAALALFAAGHGDALRSTLAHLPPSAGPAERAAVREGLESAFARDLSFMPFRLLFGWALFAGGLALSARLFLRPAGLRYAHYLSLVIHAEVVLLIGQAVSLIPLPVPALSHLFSSEDMFVASLLTSTNCITLWHLLVLSTGLSVLCGARTRTSILAAGVVWAGSLALNAGLLALLVRVYRFPI